MDGPTPKSLYAATATPGPRTGGHPVTTSDPVERVTGTMNVFTNEPRATRTRTPVTGSAPAGTAQDPRMDPGFGNAPPQKDGNPVGGPGSSSSPSSPEGPVDPTPREEDPAASGTP